MAIDQAYGIMEAVKADLSRKVASLAGAEVFGLSPCGAEWGELFAKYSVLYMFECTEGIYLNNSEIDCLLGKLREDLTVNCC